MYFNQQYENLVRSQIGTNPSGESQIQGTGLTDIEGAKAVARRLFDTYDRDRNGQVDNVEVVPMIVDVYKSFNMIFSPSRGDIDSFFKVLDRNNDGRITLQDVEDLCIRYLTNQVPTQIRASGVQQTQSTYGSNKQSQYQSNQYEQNNNQRRPQVIVP